MIFLLFLHIRCFAVLCLPKGCLLRSNRLSLNLKGNLEGNVEGNLEASCLDTPSRCKSTAADILRLTPLLPAPFLKSDCLDGWLACGLYLSQRFIIPNASIFTSEVIPKGSILRHLASILEHFVSVLGAKWTHKCVPAQLYLMANATWTPGFRPKGLQQDC